MSRQLDIEAVEGEIGLVINYTPGVSHAIDVLQGAMALIQSLDRLDHALLSSIDTNLEPVSILNDVVHSSLKLLLARALRRIPDQHLGSLEWKKWAGELLIKGKHKLLGHLDADAPEIQRIVDSLKPDYKAAPGLVGYDPPKVSDIKPALEGVAKARALLAGQKVNIQSELGDIELYEVFLPSDAVNADSVVAHTVVNRGREFFKIKTVDMLGKSQWTILRNDKLVRITILHESWLAEYQNRKIQLLPQDSLECLFEETTSYDASGNELSRNLAVVEVLRVISPPLQGKLI